MNEILYQHNHLEINNQSFQYLHPSFLYRVDPIDAKIALNHCTIHEYRQKSLMVLATVKPLANLLKSARPNHK